MLKTFPSNINPVLKNRIHCMFKHQWITPVGYDTGIRVYNIHLKKTVPLIFPNKHLVKWYICGPTVYDDSHIGHASCYIRFDIIRRILEEYYDVWPIVALGMTDVSEKITQKARTTQETFRQVARRYEIDFFNQMELLNVASPAATLRVSEHMPKIISFVEDLVKKNAAYATVNGNVYFDTSVDLNYGRFKPVEKDSNLKPKSDKRSILDFALWKKGEENEDVWESPWGRGKPGWHIECSAMAGYIFGAEIDIHSGGADLIFPHHENEETQSCSYHNRQQWVNYWLHAGLLQLDRDKMSKSLHNFIPISEFLRTNSSDHLRMFCCLTHYRSDLHYSEEAIQRAAAVCSKIAEFLGASESYVKGTWILGDVKEAQLLQELESTKDEVRNHLADDFNTVSSVWCVIRLLENTFKMLHEKSDNFSSRSPLAVAAVSNYVRHFFKTFGFYLGEATNISERSAKLDAVLDAAVNFRARVRATALSSTNVDSKKELLQICDSLRTELSAAGVSIKDQGLSNSNWSFREDSVSV